MTEQASTPPPAGAGPAVLPWERPGEPFFSALIETAKQFIVSPVAAYESMPVTPDLGRPILWAILFGTLGTVVGQALGLAFRGMMLPLASGGEGGLGAFALSTGQTLAIMVLSPLIVLIALFIWSAIVHAFLLLFGGANAGFTATVRAIAYAHTVQVVQVVPMCGGLIAGVWSLVLSILGLSIAHRTSRGRAAAAVLVPFLLCCACAVAAAVFFGAMLASAFHRAR